MDDDLDQEIEALKHAFQERLDAERDATLKFKGENGIMRKKHAALSKEIDENKEEVRGRREKGIALLLLLLPFLVAAAHALRCCRYLCLLPPRCR